MCTRSWELRVEETRGELAEAVSATRSLRPCLVYAHPLHQARGWQRRAATRALGWEGKKTHWKSLARRPAGTVAVCEVCAQHLPRAGRAGPRAQRGPGRSRWAPRLPSPVRGQVAQGPRTALLRARLPLPRGTTLESPRLGAAGGPGRQPKGTSDKTRGTGPSSSCDTGQRQSFSSLLVTGMPGTRSRPRGDTAPRARARWVAAGSRRPLPGLGRRREARARAGPVYLLKQQTSRPPWGQARGSS